MIVYASRRGETRDVIAREKKTENRGKTLLRHVL